MADYYFPTVVRPEIPFDAVTDLEHAVLTQIFEHERLEDGIYFYSSDGVSSTAWLPRADAKEHLEREPGSSSRLADLVRTQLAESGADEVTVEIDLSDLGEDGIFQDIVRRCDSLDHVTITLAWTCSKMRPDGFGGGISVITADHILSGNMNRLECELLDRAEFGDLGCAPGHGSHVLVRLEEADVRRTIDELFESIGPSAVTREDVTDEDVRNGCLVIAKSDCDPLVLTAGAVATRVAIDLAAARRKSEL